MFLNVETVTTTSRHDSNTERKPLLAVKSIGDTTYLREIFEKH